MYLFVEESYLIGPIDGAQAPGLIAELIRQDSARSIVLVRRVPEASFTRDPENWNAPADGVLTAGRFHVHDVVVEIVSV